MTVPTKPKSLTRRQAVELTERIRTAAEETWRLLSEAHERGACYALGYPDWARYVRAEFGMSEQHSYRLLNHASVIKGIEKVTGSPVGESLTERETRGVRSDRVADAIRERIVNVSEDELLDIVKGVVAKEREKMAESRMGTRGQSETAALRRLFGAVDVIRLLPDAATLAADLRVDEDRFADVNEAAGYLQRFADAWVGER